MANRIFKIFLVGLLLSGCAINDKRFFSKIPHIRWSDNPTGLSENLNIDGCFFGDGMEDPIHFDDDGFAYMRKGYVPGAYKINGDTITVDWYERWDFFDGQWIRRTFRYLIVSPDTIKEIDGMGITVDTKNFEFREFVHPRIFVRFDCPEDIKVHDGFLRKQKWMWESEDARKKWKQSRKK